MSTISELQIPAIELRFNLNQITNDNIFILSISKNLMNSHLAT